MTSRAGRCSPSCRAVPPQLARRYIKNYSDIAVGLDQNHHDDWAHRLCELPNQPWKRPRVEEELYDLAEDPDEQVNLAADPEHAKRLREMRALLSRHMIETKDPFLDAPFTNDYDPKAYEPGD
jgi:arylsulfatase A-like enzyme